MAQDAGPAHIAERHVPLHGICGRSALASPPFVPGLTTPIGCHRGGGRAGRELPPNPAGLPWAPAPPPHSVPNSRLLLAVWAWPWSLPLICILAGLAQVRATLFPAALPGPTIAASLASRLLLLGAWMRGKILALLGAP